MKALHRFLLLTALVLSIDPDPLLGQTTRHVDPSDSQAQYHTIGEALAQADPGDVIRVASGVYSTATGESFPLRIAKAVDIVADPNDRPHLLGDGRHTVVSVETGGVTLRDLRITDGCGSEGINGMDGGGLCIFVGPDETRPVTIDNCVIQDCNCPSDETYDGCGGGIYCGGTYCTCFQIHMTDCAVRNNSVRGGGGGVFCALLSNVRIQETLLSGNLADDHGGAVFVDVFASVGLFGCHLTENQSPGDPLKPDWGGKGGALACASYGFFSAQNCTFQRNHARHFGGAVFTRGGLLYGEDLCGGGAMFPGLVDCYVGENRAEISGGGVYVGGSGTLDFSGTMLHWNDAGQDGGGVHVAGGAGGGEVVFSNDSQLEGNESARRGGGIYLGPSTQGLLDSTRLFGNSSLLDGGGVYLDENAGATLNNCVVMCNNSVRGIGGGFHLGPQSTANLVHCSVLGNFAPQKRSGIYLDPTASVNIRDSILWRHAGGSIEANGATVNMVSCLCDDQLTDRDVSQIDPGYVGWGRRETIMVSASASGSALATDEPIYADIQDALAAFDLRLGENSSCLGAAGDGGNLGADTGVGGTSGNVTAVLHVGAGWYDIRGRNVVFTRGLEGDDASTSTIYNAVLGYMEDASVRDLCITGEDIFGGITVRADVSFEHCHVVSNRCLADGAGVYIAEGHCVFSDSLVSANLCPSANGGGVYLCPQTKMDLLASRLERNAAANGGAVYASRETDVSASASLLTENSCASDGGAAYLGTDSTSLLQTTRISSNTAHNRGGGIYAAGQLGAKGVDMVGNTVDANTNRGGGLYIDGSGHMVMVASRLLGNKAGNVGGAITSYGQVEIRACWFEDNTAGYGAGLAVVAEPSGPSSCAESVFHQNTVTVNGGAVYAWRRTAPVFTDCQFTENVADNGGAAICYEFTRATFDRCTFGTNNASVARGGSLYLNSTSTSVRRCIFTDSTAKLDGGVAYLTGADSSRFDDCNSTASVSGGYAGAFCIAGSAQPAFARCEISSGQAKERGGGVAVLETGQPLFTDTTLDSCRAVYGGGVYAAEQSSIAFAQCDFLGNKAFSETASADGGGAFLTENAAGWFTRCRFEGNGAQDDGGGMAIADRAQVHMQNTLFASNTAEDDGGAMHFTSRSQGTLMNCTLVLNSSIHGGTGGGLYLEPDNDVRVDSCIIWQNNPDGIRPQADPAVSYSCVQGAFAWPGTGNSASDPLFDPTTFWLQDVSPCIDAGDPAPKMNDGCQPPGKGATRNDRGITGGPCNCAIANAADPNLAGWWTFDETFGPWTLDRSGRGQHAVLINGAASVTGPLGGAVRLDSVDDYVALPIGELLSTLKNSTFTIWVNFRNTGGSWQRVFDFGSGTGTYMFLTPRIGTNGAMRFAIKLGGPESLITAPATLPTGWHHVAVVFEHGNVTLLLDSERVGEVRTALTPSSLGVTSNNWLGRSQFSADGYLSAELDDFRIYDRALSDQELLAVIQGCTDCQ